MSVILSARQREVAMAVVNGMSAKGAAAHFGISQRTVEAHLHTARMRYGVKTAAGLGAAILKERIVGQVYNLNEGMPGTVPLWRPVPQGGIGKHTVFDVVRREA